jgi:hypothetical protein
VQQDLLHERTEINTGHLEIHRGRPGARIGVHDGKIELMIGTADVDEEREDFVEHLHGTRVFAVDLVDDGDDRQILLERFSQHEAGLRQRAFCGVDEQQHAVDHLQHAFDLAAEIGVPGRIDDVDLGLAPENPGVLREDRYAALAFDRIHVHDALALSGGVAKDTGLAEHAVD